MNYLIPLVSIIVPIYNVEKYIKRCVESILNQTYRNIELILVYDFSPDNSMIIAKQTIKRALSDCIRVKYIRHNVNLGLSVARNTGIDAATGEYVFFLDSDDEICKDCISKLMTPNLNYTYDFVIGELSVIGGKRRLSKNIYNIEFFTNSEIIESYALGEWPIYACNKLYSKEFLKTNHLHFERGIVHEDILWSFQIACIASSMFYVSDETYVYFVHDESISKSKDNLKSRIGGLSHVHKAIYSFVVSHKLFDYVTDSAIRRTFPLFEETMRQQYVFSLWDYYRLLRFIDCRTINQKRLIYNTIQRRTRYFDYFLPVRLGFCYRYLYWSLVRLKSGRKDIPFVY